MAPIAPMTGPALAEAPLVETVDVPEEVPEGGPVDTVPLPETTDVTSVELPLEEIVATEDATDAMVVALFTDETTPFPPA